MLNIMCFGELTIFMFCIKNSISRKIDIFLFIDVEICRICDIIKILLNEWSKL
jgi:hypothetical protein